MNTTIILVCIILALTAALVGLVFRYRIIHRLIEKVYGRIHGGVKEIPDLKADARYVARTELFRMYPTNSKAIVMLGDSLTHRVDWDEILCRSDVANRGINGDRTDGMLARIDDVVRLSPNSVFVMGGINDIVAGVEVEIVAENLAEICRTLSGHGIAPVVQSALYLGKAHKEHRVINTSVKKLNDLISESAGESKYAYLDICRSLCSITPPLLNHDCTSDGTHLSAEGYRRWAVLLNDFLCLKSGE